MPRRASGRFITLLSALCLGTISLAACSSDDVTSHASYDDPAYVLSSEVATVNAGSVLGASTNAELVSGRVYPGVYVPGPSGQLIPNTDLITAQALPGTHKQVIYTISKDAVLDDGTPLTCADYLLSWTAGVMDNQFDSKMPIAQQVQELECKPNDQKFTVVFKEDQGAQWRALFGPGEVLPSAPIRRRLGLSEEEFVSQLHSQDPSLVASIAEAWNTAFDFAEFQPDMHLSYGPYKVEGVGDKGQVILSRNENYYGDMASIPRIALWPASTDVRRLNESGKIYVADMKAADYSWVDRNDPKNPYSIAEQSGILVDSLILGTGGPFATAEGRRAFNACVDQKAVADASSKVSGQDVAPQGLRSVAPNDPVRNSLVDVSDRVMAVDPISAEQLSGSTIRIGYLGDDQRKSEMVKAIKQSCAPFGIEVVDVHDTAGGHLGDLAATEFDIYGNAVDKPGEMDAVLKAVDPVTEYGNVGIANTKSGDYRWAEDTIDAVTPTIPLSTQPRTFIIHRDMGNVVPYTGLTGIGWNIDRWKIQEG